MRRLLPAFLVALVASPVLCSCGGSSDGSGVDKTAVFDAIEAEMSTFDGTNQDLEDQGLLTFVQGRSEFTDSGLADGGVWASFADGTTVVMGNNFIATRPELTKRSARRAPGALPVATPGSTNVVLGTSLGTTYEAVNDDIAQMFEQELYDRVQPDSTVDALMSLNNVGVLYLNAHGVSAPIHRGGLPEYLVWTSTVRERDGSTDTKYQADLADGTLTYYISHTFEDDDASPDGVKRVAGTHYAITTKFVEKYWTGKFAANSVVFINACKSASEDALLFELACLQGGAGLYYGWTDRVVGADSALSAAWLFDRALGTNSDKLKKEVPPQRPFPLSDVWGEMLTRPRRTGGIPLAESFNPQTGLTAMLMPFSLGDDTELLAPSIESLSVNPATDELAVNGSLGDVPGHVVIGDTDLNIKSWTELGAICDLPRTGASSAGPIQVVVGGSQFSNVVPLTQWHGTATYTVEEVGSLTMTMTFDFTFRGDIHGPREAPGQMPVDPGLAFEGAPTTSATYTFSGMYDDAPTHFHVDWGGSGTMPWSPTAGGAGSYVYSVGTILDGMWSMSVTARALAGNHVHTIQRNAAGMIISDQMFDQDGVGVSNFPPSGSPFSASVDGAYDIASGSQQTLVPSAYSATAMARISLVWSAFPAQFAPTSTTTR